MAFDLGVGSAKDEALAGFATEIEKLGKDLVGLHAFGRDVQAEGEGRRASTLASAA
jgi:hypothetical protein